MSEEFDIDDGIFSGGEVAAGLRKSAEALGINPDLVDPEAAQQTKKVARRNCKKCCGRGVLKLCLSPQKKKLFYRMEGPTKVGANGRRIRLKGPTPKRNMMLSGFSPANELDKQWKTGQPEPSNYKEENSALVLCTCVREISA